MMTGHDDIPQGVLNCMYGKAGAYAQARGKFQLVRITHEDVEAAYNECNNAW